MKRVALLSVVVAGCLSRELPPWPDGGPARVDAGRSPPRVRAVVVADSEGTPWPLDAAPRRPVVTFFVEGDGAGDPEPALLFLGEPDDALRDDLGQAPLRAADAARVMEAVVDRHGDRIDVVPVAPLEPGTTLTAALAGWAGEATGPPLGAPHLTRLRVADAEAGAVPTASWPPAATAGVPVTLPLAAVRFDDRVEGFADGVALVAGAGATPVDTDVAEIDCREIGWPDGFCVALHPRGPLAEGAEHRLVVGPDVVDRSGAAVGPWETRFTTAVGAPVPVSAIALPCALDEIDANVGCSLADDRSVELRLQWTAPMRFFLAGAGLAAEAVAPRGDAVLRLAPLPPGSQLTATLHAIDLAGVDHGRPVDFTTTPPLEPIYITEVRADPRGPEPAQEYVELLNDGPDPVSLLGFALSDRPDTAGDVIDVPLVIPSLARVLVVPDGFDPLHPEDDPVPAGVPLVRIGSSLASGGLANGGEPLFLRDAAGHRLSAAPATPVPRPGVCVLRVARDGRSGRPGTFDRDAAAGCTPGLPDRPPP